MDLKAFFSLSYGVYVISSFANEKDTACIANTFTQVTAEPPKVSIALHKDNYTTSLIKETRVFNCSVLLADVEMDTIRRFGFQSGRDVNKFDGISYIKDELGIKHIDKEIAATFSCKVEQVIDVGTHVIYIGEVVACHSYSNEPVLTYADYHTKKKGTTPKLAPSYVKEVTKKGYRCTICGFILEDEVLPDDYKCPICNAPADLFEKI